MEPGQVDHAECHIPPHLHCRQRYGARSPGKRENASWSRPRFPDDGNRRAFNRLELFRSYWDIHFARLRAKGIPSVLSVQEQIDLFGDGTVPDPAYPPAQHQVDLRCHWLR